MSKKTTALLTTAGLALTASPAIAERPADAGKKGRDNAAQKSEKRSAKSKKSKGVGFTLSGIGLSSLPVADGALTDGLTLDVTSANKHARTFLKLSKADIAGTGTFSVGSAGDKVLVRFNGLSSSDTLQATDRVKVIGKVTRVRKGDSTTVRSLDIRKIVVTREDSQAEQPQTEQPETAPAAS